MHSPFVNKTVAFDQNTASTFAVVAAPTNGKRIRITGYELTSAGSNTIVFKDGTTALSGAMPLIAGSRLGVPPDEKPAFETRANTAFNVTLSAAVQVAGYFTYQLVD